MVEILISNGTIIDGTGSPAFKGDIAIDKGLIAYIGSKFIGEAVTVIDAEGLIVAPGFIDIHSHSDISLLFDPRAESKVVQGITTEVVGNCGVSAAPVRPQYREELIRQFETNNFTMTPEEKEMWQWHSQIQCVRETVARGVSSNLVPLVGGVPVRISAVGMKREINSSDLQKIKRLLENELDQGVWGMSSGLYYVPERYYSTPQLIELCKLIGRKKKVWSVHIRDEGKRVFQSVKEVLEIAFRSSVSLQISHLKLEGKSNWGRAGEILALLHKARRQGIDVNWDQYPYTAYGSGLIDVIPPSLRAEGIDKLLMDLNRPRVRNCLKKLMLLGTDDWPSPLADVEWTEMIIAEVKNDKELVGKTIRELAQEWGSDPLEVIMDLLLSQDAGVKVIVPAMSEQDVQEIMEDPETIISTDGKAVSPRGRFAGLHPHPRYYGAFPRVLGRYVRERKVIDLVSAIRKMTSLPAQKIGLRDRGVLALGKVADVVVFDPNTVADQATYSEPHHFPVGIKYVIVNGVEVISAGKHTGQYPGQLICT